MAFDKKLAALLVLFAALLILAFVGFQKVPQEKRAPSITNEGIVPRETPR